MPGIFFCNGRRVHDEIQQPNPRWRAAALASGVDYKGEISGKGDTSDAASKVRIAIQKRVNAGHYDRIPCGHDLTDLIQAIPADGFDHEVKCPACGTTGMHHRDTGVKTDS